MYSFLKLTVSPHSRMQMFSLRPVCKYRLKKRHFLRVLSTICRNWYKLVHMYKWREIVNKFIINQPKTTNTVFYISVCGQEENCSLNWHLNNIQCLWGSICVKVCDVTSGLRTGGGGGVGKGGTAIWFIASSFLQREERKSEISPGFGCNMKTETTKNIFISSVWSWWSLLLIQRALHHLIPHTHTHTPPV